MEQQTSNPITLADIPAVPRSVWLKRFSVLTLPTERFCPQTLDWKPREPDQTPLPVLAQLPHELTIPFILSCNSSVWARKIHRWAILHFNGAVTWIYGLPGDMRPDHPGKLPYVAAGGLDIDAAKSIMLTENGRRLRESFIPRFWTTIAIDLRLSVCELEPVAESIDLQTEAVNSVDGSFLVTASL